MRGRPAGDPLAAAGSHPFRFLPLECRMPLASRVSRLAILCSLATLVLVPVAHAQGTVYHDGIGHQALGAAGVALDPAGRLKVSNIGSSGQDGVAIDWPDG